MCSGNDWEQLVKRGALHGGDNDSTGIIGASLWGAIYGFEGVIPSFEKLEFRERYNLKSIDSIRLEKAAVELCSLFHEIK